MDLYGSSGGSHRRRHSPPSPPSSRHYDDRYGGRGDRHEKRYRRHDYPPGYPASRSIPVSELARRSSFYSLKEFLEYQDRNLPEHDAVRMYSEYKESYLRHHLCEFFELHKRDAWFADLYAPSRASGRSAEKNKIVEGEYHSFVQQLQNGDLAGCCLDEQVADSVAESEDSPPETAVERDPSQQGDSPSGEGPGPRSETPECIRKGFLHPLAYPRLFVKNIPPTVSRAEIADAAKKAADFKSILLSEPAVDGGFFRDGWLVYESGTDLNQVLGSLPNGRLELSGGPELELGYVKAPLLSKIKTCPEIVGSEENLQKSLALAAQLCSRFCKENQLEVPAQLEADGAVPSSVALAKSRLDLLVTFLRNVFFFCFYCGLQTESSDELLRRCGSCHIRKVNSVKSQQHQAAWQQRHEQRIGAVLGKSEVLENPAVVAPKTVEGEMSAWIVKVEEAKFRCNLCSKLFKGPEFVEKHIRLKHPERVEEAEGEVALYTNYIKDYPRLPAYVPQYFASAPAAAEPPRAPAESYGHERRASRDHHAPGRQARLQGEPRRNPYEGRRLKTYVDLDAPVVGDVDLFY